MARSSADDMELKRGCEAGILAKGDRDKVVMCMRVAKSRGSGGGLAKVKLTSRHNMAKPRVLAVTGQYPSPALPASNPCTHVPNHDDDDMLIHSCVAQPRSKGRRPSRSCGCSSTPMAASSRCVIFLQLSLFFVCLLFFHRLIVSPEWKIVVKMDD